MDSVSPLCGESHAPASARAALERGIGPKQGWRVHRATGDRYRARRAIVKVRVVKFRNAKLFVSRGHLAYLQREVAAMRVTTADRHISNGMEKLNNTIDLRAGSAASTFPANSSMNRHILIGRMKHLEKMGLAQSMYDGLWRVEKDAFKTL